MGYQQNQTGTPCLNPMFFNYPQDENTFAIDYQFFYGDSMLISPVTEENSTSVSFYLPDDIFYAWGSGEPVRGEGAYVDAEVPFDEILVRNKGFNIVIAPGLDGSASGTLYLDDGESLSQ